MKFPQVFTKTPSYKRFSFTPRFYDPQEEERKERENRIRKELFGSAAAEQTILEDAQNSHRERIAGSFRSAKKTATVQADPSANMLRLTILLILAVGIIGFLQWGNIAIYVLAAILVPVYLYSKFRSARRKDN